MIARVINLAERRDRATRAAQLEERIAGAQAELAQLRSGAPVAAPLPDAAEDELVARARFAAELEAIAVVPATKLPPKPAPRRRRRRQPRAAPGATNEDIRLALRATKAKGMLNR